jgi:predicted dinucleotide-binding enzyme
MNIGIIGAGQVGGTLTRRLSALGHKVFVANSRWTRHAELSSPLKPVLPQFQP